MGSSASEDPKIALFTHGDIDIGVTESNLSSDRSTVFRVFWRLRIGGSRRWNLFGMVSSEPNGWQWLNEDHHQGGFNKLSEAILSLSLWVDVSELARAEAEEHRNQTISSSVARPAPTTQGFSVPREWRHPLAVKRTEIANYNRKLRNDSGRFAILPQITRKDAINQLSLSRGLAREWLDYAIYRPRTGIEKALLEC